MAKKSVKKVSSGKGSKARVVVKRSGSPKKAAKKPSRRGGSHVSIGLHGMKEVMQKIKDAGCESELNRALDGDDLFVKVQRKSLTKIKDFMTRRKNSKNSQKRQRAATARPMIRIAYTSADRPARVKI